MSSAAASTSGPSSAPPPPPSAPPNPLMLSSILLAHGLTAASLKVESALSNTHDAIQQGVHSVLSAVEGKGEERERGRRYHAGKGKGKDKSSAIVLFCPSTSSNLQSLTTSLALSLASSPSETTTAHTVLVLLTSADQLAPLLTAWAERKAAILAEQRWSDLEEEVEEEEEGGEKIPVGRWTFSAAANADEKQRAGRSLTPPDTVLLRGEDRADWARRGAPPARRGDNGKSEEEDEHVEYISGFYLSHPWHFLAYMLPAPLRFGLGWGVRISLDMADRLGLSGYEKQQQQAEHRRERRGRERDSIPTSSTPPASDAITTRARTRSIAQDVVELGRDMMKGLRIGSTSPNMSWSGTFPLPSLSPERRHPHPSRSTTTMSAAGGELSPVLLQSGPKEGEGEGTRSWGLHWEGGLSFHVSTPWWSTLNPIRPPRSKTSAESSKSKGTQKQKKKPRDRAQIGAVIPILIEGEQAEERARESIQAFCEAHDLLCRGLVLIPSELDGNVSSQPPPHLSMSSRRNGNGRHKAPEAMNTTAHALPLVRALLPQLRRDRGRVVALEMVEADGLLVLASTRQAKPTTTTTTNSKKRANGWLSREGIYWDAVAAQRRLSGIWGEVEQEVERQDRAHRSAELPTATSAQRSYAAASTFRTEGEWRSSWDELQAEEFGSLAARVTWVGKVAWQAATERAVRRPVRRVRRFAGWLLDAWEAEVGGGADGVQICRVRVAPVIGTSSENVLADVPASLLSYVYPNPSQAWPPAIRKVLAAYLRARSKVVPASRQIIYHFGANALEASSQRRQERVLLRRRRQQQRGRGDGREEVVAAEGSSTMAESSVRQRRRPVADPVRSPVQPGSELQSPRTQAEIEDPMIDDEDTTAPRSTGAASPPSPPLLAKLIRSAVEEEWARAGYCVGLGARVEGLLPGWVKAVCGWAVYQVL
ncbi:unnamed protein product [Tilletia controversa]|nr:unnamed protein product [Tilletia controversa]